MFFHRHIRCETLYIAENVLDRDVNGNFAKLLISLKHYTPIRFNIELINNARRVVSYTSGLPSTKRFDLLKRGKNHDTHFSFVRC